jgi:hypothetical protein
MNMYTVVDGDKTPIVTTLGIPLFIVIRAVKRMVDEETLGLRPSIVAIAINPGSFECEVGPLGDCGFVPCYSILTKF